MTILDFAISNTNSYISSMPKEIRKAYGQFFTAKETALFMASLFTVKNCATTLSILDPGAGSGILSMALIDRLQEHPNLQDLKLVCFENDPNIIELLQANLAYAAKHSKIKLNYRIVESNYILSQQEAYHRAYHSYFHEAKKRVNSASKASAQPLSITDTEATEASQLKSSDAVAIDGHSPSSLKNNQQHSFPTKPFQGKELDSFLGKELEPLQELEHFDVVISNPPYRKINKEAWEAKAMEYVCYGAPNLYFLFAAMSMFNLKDEGQMVYIIPRSWTSGAYFKRFRHKLVQEGVLEHIHLFVSRDKVFTSESVLQETMIVKLKKTRAKPNTVKITTSKSNADCAAQTSFEAPYDSVINGADDYVYLITSKEELSTLSSINKLQDTLPSLGLKMRTGLTVDFRNKECLKDKEDKDNVPLFYAQHLKNGKVKFPLGIANEYLSQDKQGLLQANKNYLFVKRFTAKEEKQRLQCAVYLASKQAKFNKISTDNKLNFIEGNDNLEDSIVYGLYVLFNSTTYDNYYRILNGSTQVNATQINDLPVPPLKIIEELGKDLIKAKDMSQSKCDQILKAYLPS